MLIGRYSAAGVFCFFSRCSWLWGTLMIPRSSLSGAASTCTRGTTWKRKSVSLTLFPSSRHTTQGLTHTEKTNFAPVNWKLTSSLCFPSLMMCGVLATMFEHYKEAQTLLERATSIESESVVSWTLLGETRVSVTSYSCYAALKKENTDCISIRHQLVGLLTWKAKWNIC